MGVPPSPGPILPSPSPAPAGPGAAQSRPPLPTPRHSTLPVGRSPARLRGSSRSCLAPLPPSRASPNTSACPGIFHRRAEGREGGRGLKSTPPSPSGSNLPCIVTTVRSEAGEAGLQLAIEPLALQTEGLGLLQIHFYFPGQRLYSLLA